MVDGVILTAIQIAEDSSHEPSLEQSHEQSREPSYDPSRSSAERTAPPRSAHVHPNDDLRLLDPARGGEEVDEFSGSAMA